jgi:hypothetical protein
MIASNYSYKVIATYLNCGKVRKILTTTPHWKQCRGTRLIADPNGNNVKIWMIRSQVPNGDILAHGKGSETKWVWGQHCP